VRGTVELIETAVLSALSMARLLMMMMMMMMMTMTTTTTTTTTMMDVIDCPLDTLL